MKKNILDKKNIVALLLAIILLVTSKIVIDKAKNKGKLSIVSSKPINTQNTVFSHTYFHNDDSRNSYLGKNIFFSMDKVTHEVNIYIIRRCNDELYISDYENDISMCSYSGGRIYGDIGLYDYIMNDTISVCLADVIGYNDYTYYSSFEIDKIKEAVNLALDDAIKSNKRIRNRLN